jgi:WD40 repeat protein
MSLRKGRHLLVTSLLAVPLAVALTSSFHGPGRRSDGGDDGGTTLAGHACPVQALAFGPDGATLISVASSCRAARTDVEVAAWDVGTGHPVWQRLEYPGTLRCLALDPGGRALATAGQDRSLWVCDTAGPHERRRLGDTGSLVYALAFSPDGGQLATADIEGGVTLWDVVSGRSRPCVKASGYGWAGWAFAPDGRILARGETAGTVRLWDGTTREERAALRGHTRVVLAVAFSPDGRTLATGDVRGVVKLWDAASRTERATLMASDDEDVPDEVVSALSFSPHGGFLAVVVGAAVQLWDVDRGRRVARLAGHQRDVKCLAFSPDGTRLASGGYDCTVRLWEVAQYRPRRP